MFFFGSLKVLLFLRVFYSTLFFVDGPSMLPTLRNGELFWLDEYTYMQELPQRGDIVVFSFLEEPDYFYVKRVIGLPGERVFIDGKQVTIEKNGLKFHLDENYLELEDSIDLAKELGHDRFTVPQGKYFVLGDNRSHSLDSRLFRDPYVPLDRIKGKFFLQLWTFQNLF